MTSHSSFSLIGSRRYQKFCQAQTGRTVFFQPKRTAHSAIHSHRIIQVGPQTDFLRSGGSGPFKARLSRALLSQVLETFKDGDCTVYWNQSSQVLNCPHGGGNSFCCSWTSLCPLGCSCGNITWPTGDRRYGGTFTENHLEKDLALTLKGQMVFIGIVHWDLTTSALYKRRSQKHRGLQTFQHRALQCGCSQKAQKNIIICQIKKITQFWCYIYFEVWVLGVGGGSHLLRDSL